MTPEELIEYADDVMLGMKAAKEAQRMLSAVELQAALVTVDSARLAVELATLKLRMREEP